jgi:hypothetical protein
MHSPGHRANLLSPDVDRVGIAVVAARGVLYAVADYSRGVEQLSAAQVEARVAALIRVSGVAILRDPSVARAACATDEGMPRAEGGEMPRFVMRWQDGDLTPVAAGAGGQAGFRQLSAGGGGELPGAGDGGGVSAYRVAVIVSRRIASGE